MKKFDIIESDPVEKEITDIPMEEIPEEIVEDDPNKDPYADQRDNEYIVLNRYETMYDFEKEDYCNHTKLVPYNEVTYASREMHEFRSQTGHWILYDKNKKFYKTLTLLVDEPNQRVYDTDKEI